MKYTAEIKEVVKDRIVTTGEQFLDVTVEIREEGAKKVLETRKLGFPIETTDKEIQASVKKLLALKATEQASAVEQAKVDKAEANANKVIDNLVGQEIKS